MELIILLASGLVIFGSLAIAYYLIKWTCQTFHYIYQTTRTARRIRRNRQP